MEPSPFGACALGCGMATCESAQVAERDEAGALSIASLGHNDYPRYVTPEQDATPASASRGHLASTLDSAPFVWLANNLLTVIGRDGCFKRLAPHFPSVFGYAEGELVDRPFLTFIHPDDIAPTTAALQQLARGEPTLGLENRFRCKDASYRRLVWTAILTSEGPLNAVARDITPGNQPEDEQARSMAREQAAALAQKERFLASVCHDLQQPLTVILAQTQLLQRHLARGESIEPERLETQLAFIFAAAPRMRGMTQDLLEASMQESGRPLALLLAKTELVSLTRAAVHKHQLVSNLHQFVFEAETPSMVVPLDEMRAHRVLANLLANAIKYSPEGGPVHVTLKQSDGPDGTAAVLVVRDEGVGIPRDDLPHVFDRFHRGANVVGRFAGTGIGLASARELVELYGGSISVDSQEAPAARSSCAYRSRPQLARLHCPEGPP